MTANKLTKAQRGALDLVWRCDNCNHVEEVDVDQQAEGYTLGDTEPCIHCEDGIARITDAGRAALKDGEG